MLKIRLLIASAHVIVVDRPRLSSAETDRGATIPKPTRDFGATVRYFSDRFGNGFVRSSSFSDYDHHKFLE